VRSSVPARLGAFVVVVVVAFAAAFGVGRAVGPVGDDPAPSPATTAPTPDGHPADGHGGGS
jgi:hypothetical protein